MQLPIKYAAEVRWRTGKGAAESRGAFCRSQRRGDDDGEVQSN